jgi:outer membrane protein OmpA-like peptidoglycan-associated protein
MKVGMRHVYVALVSVLMVDASLQEHSVSLSRSAWGRGTSFADVFLGTHARSNVAVRSGSDAAVERLHQKANPIPLGIGASTLTIFVFFGIFAILAIAFKTGQQAEEIDKLHARTRGMQQDWMAKELMNQKDAAKRRALERELAQEEKLIQAEKDRLQREQEQLRSQQAAEAAARAKIARQQEEIQGLAKKDKQLVDQILARGKVSVDLDKKLFKLIEPIEFKSVFVKTGTKHAPPAEFANPDAANEVLQDLAEILATVTKPRLLIEGHTAGGSKAVSDIGFEIACERAEKVVKTLVSLGVSKDRLESKGKPGLLGDNKFDTKIITLSW